jgi:thiaminase
MENCLPVAGKKQDSKKRKKAECQKLCRSIETILDNLTSYFPESPDTKLAEDLVIFVLKEFQEWCEKNEKLLNKIKFSYSKRGKQTGDIPFADAKGYDKQIYFR